MLGFRRHFSTKSRAYPATLGALRAARSQHQPQSAIAAGLLPGPATDTTLVLAHWHFAGRGHPPISPLTGATTRPGLPQTPNPPPGDDHPWTGPSSPSTRPPHASASPRRPSTTSSPPTH